MPLNRKPLALEADPQSVRRAREWVCEVLGSLGRHDLVDAAELAVSELVTNAILHAKGPITVSVRGTRRHPRVEVRDHSENPPEVNVEMADEDYLLATTGRGLGIVALYSATWGAELAPDGKTVWFEPTAELRSDGDLSGTVFDLQERIQHRLAEAAEPEQLIPVRFIAMPVPLFARFRQKYEELRRELALLSLAHGDDYPLSRELTDLFVQIEQERRQSRGVEQMDAAIAAGLERVDLEYHVPPSVPGSMARLRELLARADEFCRSERLLTMASEPELVALRNWYLEEFIRQAAGEEPTPWSGMTSTGDDELSSA